MCYKFMDKFKQRPRSYDELFGSVDFIGAENALTELTRELAKIEEKK